MNVTRIAQVVEVGDVLPSPQTPVAIAASGFDGSVVIVVVDGRGNVRILDQFGATPSIPIAYCQGAYYT
ncbi:hypothetical protein P5G50_18410 [Leifsonia sp. F6_8S_P_1B]|uniref:Uncharacterized protein n=1 Tax=Leifsonia williamsii TaxID=3035919 RepID=A0ABT8KG30_9MICO|nr:hypothetical protein [Leifsonia williamsii]MDN4616425.1 hypothetical protein [Leifsonia williamsii]